VHPRSEPVFQSSGKGHYQLISTGSQFLERLFDSSIACSGATIDIGLSFDELQEYARLFYTLGLSKVPMRVSTKNQAGYPRRGSAVNGAAPYFFMADVA
jgi:hypothetical protein